MSLSRRQDISKKLPDSKDTVLFQDLTFAILFKVLLVTTITITKQKQHKPIAFIACKHCLSGKPNPTRHTELTQLTSMSRILSQCKPSSQVLAIR